MDFKMKPNVSLLILIISLLHRGLCASLDDIDKDVSNLKDRVSQLEANVNILILTSGIDKVLDNIDDTKTEVTEPDSSESITEVADDCESHSAQPTIIPLEARRQALENNMVKFTVKYQSSVTPINASWHCVSGEVQGTNTAMGTGVYETSTIVPVSQVSTSVKSSLLPDGPGVWVSLVTPDFRDSLILFLSYEEGDEVETEIPVPLLEIQPTGDFVYAEGEDVTFKATLPGVGENGTNPDKYIVSVSFTMYHPDTGDVYRDDASHIGDLLDMNDCPNSMSAALKLNTSENRVSGLMETTSGIINDEGLIRRVMRVKDVIVRPSSQAGPFPDDFLGFVKYPSTNYFGFGSGRIDCRLDEECIFHCRAVGSDITDLSVVKITASGRTEPVVSSDSRYSVQEFTETYAKTKQVSFTADSVPEEPESFRCVARNADGKEVFLDATLDIIVPLEIIKEDSGIELVTDQEEDNSKTFKISCTVKAHPQPNVTFTTRTGYSYDGYQPTDEIVDLDDHSYTMIKYVTYHASEYHSPGWHLSATCEARLDEPYWFWGEHEMSYDGDLK